MPEQQTDCTPAAQKELIPCLKCLSLSQLEMLKLFLLSVIEGTYDLPEDFQQLLEDSACFTCLSDKEKLEGELASMASLAGGRGESHFEDFVEAFKCLPCAKPGQIKAATALLLCKWFESAVPN